MTDETFTFKNKKKGVDIVEDLNWKALESTQKDLS